jgi:hypothetical protein
MMRPARLYRAPVAWRMQNWDAHARGDPAAGTSVATNVALAPQAPVNTSTVQGRGQLVTLTVRLKPCPSNTPVVVLVALGVDPAPPLVHEYAVGLLM